MVNEFDTRDLASHRPEVAAVAGSAVAIAAAVLLGLGACAGPDVTASARPSPVMSPSPGAVTGAALFEPADSVTIDAVDETGPWGSITIRRGEDTGGYAVEEIDPDAFVIELFVQYEAERQPAGEFGVSDWVLATADDRLPIGSRFEPTMPPNPQGWDRTRQPLGTWPGAVEVTNTTVEGLVAFLVPRELGDERLELIYRPGGSGEAVEAIPVRQPGPAPDPVPTATPVPTAGPVSYVQRSGLPFTVIDHPKADELFAEPDTCTNPVAGYTVTYPDIWYTNTAIGDTPACTWFAPTDYEVAGAEVPDEVVIVIKVFDGAVGFFNAPDYAFNEQVPIDRFAGHRHEQIGVRHEGGAYQALPPSYEYFAIVGDGPVEGPTMIASTGGDGAPDYELNKAVLDRIMASMEFEDR